jgi:prepilin-type N-terminal cleavage/methylation domain-containing protein
MTIAGRNRPTPTGQSARTGFTLLEVLAAVAILSIWFIVIAGTAMQGLRAEGVSRRRLEAGMLADRILSDLEASTIDGSVPEPIEEMSEQGDYAVTVIVAPFSGDGSALAEGVGNAPAPDAAAPALPLDQLIASEMPERSADLRRIDVRVAWLEGEAEQWVTRTTFVFDLVTARQAYDAAGLQTSSSATPTDTPDPGTTPREEDAQ